VKVAALLLLAVGLLAPADREGNFQIRFEPKAILQTRTAVPFEITVTDSLRKPVAQASVSLAIETSDNRNYQVFRAPSIAAGLYLAKPIFTEAGNWAIRVDVRRGDQLSTRTMQFSVRD
jgi:hypothetical protein